MPAEKQLLLLVARLVDSRELRREFNADPEGVATRAGLSDAEKKILFSMDVGVVGPEVGQQIINLKFDFMKGEFPRTGEMFEPDLDETDGEYPAPTPTIFRFRPTTAPIAGGKFELNVFGQSFTRDAKIVLTPGGGASAVVVKGYRVFGTYRCSHARCVVTPPANTTGHYLLQIQNAPDLASKPALIPPDAAAPRFKFT